MKKKHKYPDWVIAHRKPGTELRFINNTYYLYQVSSFYDATKKKGRKKTGPLLGKITQKEGFIQSSKHALKEKTNNVVDTNKISIRECGFTNFIKVYGKEIDDKLKKFFPKHHKQILYMAYTRIVHNSPINRMPLYVSKSMLSIEDKEMYYPKKFSDTLTQIGQDRNKCVSYMKSFIKGGEHILVDMTNMFSGSKQMYYTKEGYNSEMVFDSQVNLMYIYSSSCHQPLFYRLLNGNTREVSGFKNCLKESGIKDAIIIADKGFYSNENINLFEDNNLNYIIPLKRNDALIDYSKLDEKSNSYFMFEDRMIWMTSYKKNGKEIKLFRDDKLKTQEQKDYLQRIESKIDGYTREQFNEKLKSFRTLALVSNIPAIEPQQVYIKYKSRNSIEVMFDGIKNILQADHSYMQKEDTLNGWMFVNHIALQWYYKIYALLTENKLLSKYSVKHFVAELSEHRMVKINNEWIEETMLKSTKDMLTKLKIYSVK